MQPEEENIPETTTIIDEKKKSKYDLSFLATGFYPYIIFTILIAIVYAKVVSYGFSGMDDNVIILDRWDIISNFSNIKEAFMRDAFFSIDYMKDKVVGFYRPMQTISFMLDAAIGGKSPWIYHLTNLLLHLFTTFSVFKLIQKFSENKILALSTVCLFAILPLLTQAVAWIPARGDLLIGLFGVLSVFLFLEYLEENKWYYLILHLLTFLISIFSKESAVILIIVYLFYLFFLANNRRIKDYVSYTIIWSILIFFYLALRLNASIAFTDYPQNIFIVFGMNLPVVVEYLSKMFFPFNLSVMAKFSIDSILIGSVLTIGLAFIVIVFKEKRLLLFWGLIWYFILIFPVLIYRGSGYETSFDYLEHRAYLPLVGIILFSSAFLNQLVKSVKPIIIYAILIAGIFIYSLISFSYLHNFEDEGAFLSKALESNNSNVVAMSNLGNYYWEKGDSVKAEKYYKSTINFDPNNISALIKLGRISMIKNDPINALKIYQKILSINPDFPDVYKDMGRLFYQTGDFNQAVKFLSKVIVIDPNDAESYSLLGNSLNTLREYSKAESVLLRSIRLDPINTYAYTNLGVTYYQLGDYNKAISNFKRAIELDSKNAIALKNIGFTYGRINNEMKQIEYFKLAAKSGSVEIQNWLKQNNISW